ncbi:MAG: murein biosynthesis integral membrane protein MurJ [Paracoccaceae bacterium]|nr:murein biosynthesis integral membrane protein MurJ [Paracoccaceae bacterium]MXZ50033.1 murein biosynthesis integral membrane protein MurJ [Paracoccaceae bacterium]MYF46660.1 murein biosynthesis integral membrane protein MurJ [Paracoccaceae bacterium]MYI92650.1 murein biosynthesis integral membrane protein MurJ [Paracoccaceae bacterium]MYJ86645.1 murein biosynthesis integral membrane protein MurJ [Paracoccaceae bacterium]
MVRPFKLLKNIFTVGFWTLVSRILGFCRDVLFAAFLGAGPLAEAFLIAFTLPNMFRRIFAEGALNLAFVPLFSKKLDNRNQAREFAENSFSVLITFLLGLIILAQLFMPFLVLAIASGFSGDDRFDLAVLFGRIAFPYVLFISAAALLSGLLNSLGRFVAAAAAPVLLNAFFILSLFSAHWLGWDIGLTLAWTVPIAGIAQFVLVWFAALRAGFNLRLKLPKFSPEIKKLLILAAPAALTGGVVQVNLLIGRQVASFTDGAVAWLSYADRLYQLPLGVVGIAVGIVLLPELSKKLAGGDHEGGNYTFNRATEAAMALTIPATVALITLAYPIVSILFERGAFTQSDTLFTSQALIIYAFGLPAFVLQKVYQPIYFARENTRTPFNFALISMLVNAVVAIGLATSLGFLASALGTTLAGWAMLGLLVFGTRKYEGAGTFDHQLRRNLSKIIIVSIIMGSTLILGNFVLDAWLYQPGIRYVGLAILVLGGLLVYGLAHLIMGTWDWNQLKGLIRNRS